MDPQERFDQIEAMMSEIVANLRQTSAHLDATATRHDARQDTINAHLGSIGAHLDSISAHLDSTAKRQEEMAARQQYHDEAFARTDAKIKELSELVRVDSENIRALARIAEAHNHRLEDLESGTEN